MPTVSSQQGDAQASRAPFRPPWVKEAPPTMPVNSSTPWVRSREARVSRDEGHTSAISRELTEARERLNAVEGTTKPPIESTPAPVRKLSKITIFPSQPSAEPVENGQQVNSRRSSSISQGMVQEQPQAVAVEPQVKQTQAAPLNKTKPQELKQEVPETQPKKTQPNVANKGRVQEQPTKPAPQESKQVEPETQPKKTQPNVANKGRVQEQPTKPAPQELKQVEPETQPKKTQPIVANKGRVQEQPTKPAPQESKQVEPETQPKKTQPNVANKSRVQEQPTKPAPQESKQVEPETQPKKTPPNITNKSKTQEQPTKPAVDPKLAAAKDTISQKLQETIPVKERYKDVKPNGPKEKRISIDNIPEERKPADKEKTIPIVIKSEVSKAPPAPPAPPGPPMPPPPPKMPGEAERKVSKPKLEKLDMLRSRPRRRPDWGTMMKEIEMGKKLNHVVCDDRSAPLVATPIKVKEQFLYESEKPNVHNILLEQIQKGVNLKRVKCNDRSKPILDGLRKFRRQMTIEEQTQKEEEHEPDELDDIDKVRDDLQSTKQMLALELRNKEALERENKRLQGKTKLINTNIEREPILVGSKQLVSADITGTKTDTNLTGVSSYDNEVLKAKLLNLEVELEKERALRLKEESPQQRRLQEEEENQKLKNELDKAQRLVEEMENKYHETVGQLELARGELEGIQRKNHILERRVSNYATRDSDLPIMKQPSAKKLAKSSSAVAKQAARADNEKEEEEEEESEYEEETESEEESSEEDEAAVQERRTARELKLLSTKIKSFKDKEEAARKERIALKEQLKKLTAALKEEKKRYKVLQREVESMASVLKEDEEDEEGDDEDEEEESETESESDSEESEDESEGDLPPEAPVEERRKNLTNRSKTHENTLAVLKKGNYMLKANVDRIKDNLFKQKEMAITLQEDLNSVLAELG